jgi:hypothetical protein
MRLWLLSTGLLVGTPFARALQQLFHASFGLFSSVQAKIQFGRSPNAQSLDQFVTNIFAGRFQAFQTLIGVGVVAFDVDPNFRRAPIRCHMHGCDAHEAYTRICEFSFDQRFNFFPQSLADTATMVLNPPTFHRTPRVKRMRISENLMQMLRKM